MTDSNNDACGVTIPALLAAALRADTRFLYTYSADLIRLVAGLDSHGSTKLSRGDASAIGNAIADYLGMPHERLAEIVAAAAMKESGRE